MLSDKEIRYLQSNDIIANVLHQDLDLHFQGQTFQVVILASKGWKNKNTTLLLT